MATESGTAIATDGQLQPTDRQLQPLDRSFFERPTEVVARDLLGRWVCRQTDDGLTMGRIAETEAYGGPEDLASHSRAGLTRRTRPMFGEVGHAYVYLVYGMHECLNVVARGDGAAAGAVLLRAIEPVSGVEQMRTRRGRASDPDAKLASGPARLCQAMAVDRSLDAHDLTTRDGLWLADGDGPLPEAVVETGPRVGVDYAGDWAARPWRFWLAGNPSVSGR
jgi:DNA-3-methyladenine glycosylase